MYLTFIVIAMIKSEISNDINITIIIYQQRYKWASCMTMGVLTGFVQNNRGSVWGRLFFFFTKTFCSGKWRDKFVDLHGCDHL